MEMRIRKFALILLVLAFNQIAVWAVGADLYAGWTDLLHSFADSNTGLRSFPTLLVPMGGLAEGMGTAYTAMSRDAGYIEYNPSGSSVLPSSELALYHHSWIADSNMEAVVYTIRFGDLGIGFGGKFLYVPFTAYNDWGAAVANNYISESIGTLNVSYNFLSNYYFSGVAVGANFKVAYRNIPDIAALSVYNQSAIALMGDLGAQTSFNLLKFYHSQSKNFSVGVVVKNLGISTLADESLPQMATAGLAWSPLRPWTIAVDFTYPFSFPGQPPAEVWNMAVGTTVTVTDFLSVQGGVLMKADNPRVSVGAALTLGTLALNMNYNLDLSGSLNPLDKFSVQAKFDLGDGGRSARAQEVDALYLQGIEAFADGNYEKALELWQEVLKIDPKYFPAADDIRTVKRTILVQEQSQSVMPK
jgi:tetratricopeptide (TPR) repeat protein